MSVESSSLTVELIPQAMSEGVTHLGNDTVVTLPGLRLEEVFALPRGALAAEPTALTTPTTVFTIGDVLSLWRAAERRLETVDADSPEYESTIADVTALRAHYQRLFEARLRQA